MLETLLSAVVVFISTSIDYLIILTIVFTQAKTRQRIMHVVGGQYLGTALLVIASLVAAFGLHFVPQAWIIGLLGLIPIALGIRAAFKKEAQECCEEEEEQEILEKLEVRQSARLFWTIALITIASGGDNLGIYIPYFATSTPAEIILALMVFATLTAGLCYLGYKLSTIKLIAHTLEKYERIIVPVVYIALGITILVESSTISTLWGMLF